MYSSRAQPLERGAQQLGKARGKLEKRKTINIYQDVYARARAGSFESPHKTDCTLTAPEPMPSRGFQEESWCVVPTQRGKHFPLGKSQSGSLPLAKWNKPWLPWPHLGKTQVITLIANNTG